VEQTRNAYKTLWKDLTGRDRLRDQGVDGKTLHWIRREGEAWIPWLRTGPSGRALVNTVVNLRAP